jgi:creatinine amidohydrolase
VAGRPWVLEEAAWQGVRRAEYDVAVLPWGSTEAHNYHLPYATDTIETRRIAEESARLAWEQGARVVVLPAVPYGVQTGQLDIPFCLNVNPTTQLGLLRDVIDSVARTSVRKLVVLNGHGGNDFKWMIRELQPTTRLFLCLVNWYGTVPPGSYFEQPGDHAGDMETSLVLHLAPELVLPLAEAGPGTERRATLEGLRAGVAWAPRPWTQVSEDTGVGDPRAATAAKGMRYYEAVTARIGGFLAELAAADPERLYETDAG